MKNNIIYERNCPQCDSIIVYSTKNTLNNAIKKSTKCKRCNGINQFKESALKIDQNKNNVTYKRNCPQCDYEIHYTTKYTFNNAIKINTKCKKCNAIKKFKDLAAKIRRGEALNGFSGKKHSNDSKEKTSAELKKAYLEGKINVSGNKNPMYGRTGEKSPVFGHKYNENFIKKYGKEGSKQRRAKISEKLSIATRGDKNPMYGKPSPIGSGNGWGGWYKGWYFRSLRELSFIFGYIERFGMEWEGGENIKYRIKYKDYNGEDKNYYPDFIINKKYMVECKPKQLWNTSSVKLKKKYAELFCLSHNLKYKMIDPTLLKFETIDDLYNKKLIVFNRTSEEKYKIYKNGFDPNRRE